ncbi:MAG: hypothetical protein IKW13_06320 [Thermoguttaceae bacterium]|nr:hypothetical protein [Thermoguttaceae bacterium]MBR5243834.1 hypothetical protein [Thermoguttaceae bacterium]
MRSEYDTYFILRTPSGAVAKVETPQGETLPVLISWGVEEGAPRFDSSRALAFHLEELAEKYSREISEYEGNHGRPWNRYPRIRAVIGYLQEAGALMFDSEKIEVEDVGPPYDDTGNDDSGTFRFDDGFEIAY